MFGKKKKEPVEEEVSKIPFLPRECDITDLDSLTNRVTQLKRCISDCVKEVEELRKYKKNALQEDLKFVVYNDRSNYFDYRSSSDSANKITNKKIVDAIVESYNYRIRYLEELIHTCDDELKWLEMKVGIGPHIGKSMFELGSFNFEPNKNHA